MEKNIGIHSIGTSLPEKRITLEELCSEYSIDFNAAKSKVNFTTKCIATRTDEHPSDFSQRSAEMALKKMNLSGKDIGLVIYTGVSRDYLPSWSMAVEVIRRLNLKNAIGYDLTLGCVGSLLALDQKNRQSKYPFSLICGAERWSQTISNKVEFSIGTLAHADGGASCIIGPGSNNQLGQLECEVYPELNSYIFTPAGGTQEPFSEMTLKNNRHFRQKGSREINIIEHYVSSYESIISKCLKANSLKKENTNYFLINQVRQEMRQRILDKIGIDPKKSPYTYEKYGHLGSADFFVSLNEIWDHLKAGDKIIASCSTPSTYCSTALFFN